MMMEGAHLNEEGGEVREDEDLGDARGAHEQVRVRAQEAREPAEQHVLGRDERARLRPSSAQVSGKGGAGRTERTTKRYSAM